jgi:hypothetical protein
MCANDYNSFLVLVHMLFFLQGGKGGLAPIPPLSHMSYSIHRLGLSLGQKLTCTWPQEPVGEIHC